MSHGEHLTQENYPGVLEDVTFAIRVEVHAKQSAVGHVLLPEVGENGSLDAHGA